MCLLNLKVQDELRVRVRLGLGPGHWQPEKSESESLKLPLRGHGWTTGTATGTGSGTVTAAALPVFSGRQGGPAGRARRGSGVWAPPRTQARTLYRRIQLCVSLN